MKYLSKTGLLSTERKPIQRINQIKAFDLEPTAIAAPFVLKPLAGLCNPFSEGCSLLCNHPAVPEVKRILQKAKDRFGQETRNKTMILPAEIAAIKAEFELLNMRNAKQSAAQHHRESSTLLLPSDLTDISDLVPEELFRKYTQTDSRPLTPAPTLASAHTRASATRRCVTPDPRSISVHEKTMLILDLRRSHSQETLSWYGGSTVNETPLLRIMNVTLTPASSCHSLRTERKPHLSCPKKSSLKPSKLAPPTPEPNKTLEPPQLRVQHDDAELGDDEMYVKRRGRRRKKRRVSSSTSVFRTSLDPETLVAGIEPESKNPSGRPSLTVQHIEEMQSFTNAKLERNRQFKVESFLDYDSLKELRRELTKEMVDMEFDKRRKIALEEAMKTVPRLRVDCEELKEIQKLIIPPNVDSELRFSLPRKFSRASVRFELPMDSRLFNSMTPLDYLREHVYLTSPRKLLYSYVFNIFRKRTKYEIALLNADEHANEDHGGAAESLIPEDNEPRRIEGNVLPTALGTIMGRTLTQTEIEEFHGLVNWSMDKVYDFQIFSVISALCERLLASNFFPNLPDRSSDPCQRIEIVDFEELDRKILGKTIDPRLETILKLISQK